MKRLVKKSLAPGLQHGGSMGHDSLHPFLQLIRCIRRVCLVVEGMSIP